MASNFMETLENNDDMSSDDFNVMDSNDSSYCAQTFAQTVSLAEYNKQATEFTQAAVKSLISSPEYRRQTERCTMCWSCWYVGDCSQQGCVECGGYALERPCPVCGGRCGAVWKRDCELSRSEAFAHWDGQCALPWDQQQGYLYNVFSAGNMSTDTLTECLDDLTTR